MSFAFLDTQGFQAQQSNYTKTRKISSIFAPCIQAAQNLFETKMCTLGFESYAPKIWNAFVIEGIDGSFNYNDTPFEAFKVVHLGTSHTGGFLNACHGNDALAEFSFGLLALSFEEALASNPPSGDLAYSCFVERSNTNWTQVSAGGDLKANVLRNTYNVYRIFITPKLGSRGMSPAVLYGCKVIRPQQPQQPQQVQSQQPQQPQQFQSQQPQQPQQFQPQQPQQFQVGAAKNESEEPIPF